jgi:hypothetical protein
LIVEIVSNSDEITKIKEISEKIKNQLKQEAVMVSIQDLEVEFI